MRRFSLFFLAFFLSLFSASSAFAVTGYLNPENLSLGVVPGESFEYQVFFSADPGSTFDVRLESFSLDEKGGYVYAALQESYIELEEVQIQLPEEDLGYYYQVKGKVPDDAPLGDVFFALFFQREAQENERITLQLVHHLYLRVGENVQQQADVKDIEINKEDASGVVFQAVSYRLYPDESVDQYFDHQAELILYDAEGLEIKRFIGDRTRLVPPLTSRGFVYLREEEDYSFPSDYDHAELLVRNEAGEILYKERIVFDNDTVFESKPHNKSAYGEQLALYKSSRFVWTDWVGHFVFIILGLSLLGYALYPKRK